MDNITITTPTGWKAVLKPFMTFGDKRQLERVWAETMTLDASTQQTQVSGKALYDAQDKAVELMVTELIAPDGSGSTTTPDAILAKIMELPEADGRAIYDKINELTASSIPAGQKKGS